MKVTQFVIENSVLNLKYPNIELFEYVIFVISSLKALFLKILLKKYIIYHDWCFEGFYE